MTSGISRSGYGVFRIADRLVGIPFGNLAEVCVVPAVSKLMVAEGPVVGAFDLRGSLVPLVDLEILSGLPRTARPIEKAAVLQHDKRQAAIVLDDIVNLTEATPTETGFGNAGEAVKSSLTGTPVPPLFRSGFVMNGRVVNCLDAQAFFSREEVPSIASTRTYQRAIGLSSASKYLVFSAGGAHFGIDAEHISATIPRKKIDTSEIGGDGGVCLGFIHHHGWKVPVVHTTEVLGLGQPADLGEAEIVVLRFPDERLLGLAVDATESLTPIPPDRMTESNPMIARVGLLPKVFVTAGGTQIFVVDFKSLSERPDLLTISDLTSRKREPTDAPRPGAVGAGTAVRESARYLVFDAGHRMAVPADQVSRILHMPGTVVRSRDGPPSIRGFFSVGDRSVPLVSLSATPIDAEEGGFVLLVSTAGRLVGFMARRICSMQTSEWRISGASQGPDTSDLVQVRDRGVTEFLPVAELARMADAIADSLDEKRAPAMSVS